MREVVQICEQGGRILDPFAGAGTTVLAAVQEGCEAVGIEVTNAYYELGTERLKNALQPTETAELNPSRIHHDRKMRRGGIQCGFHPGNLILRKDF